MPLMTTSNQPPSWPVRIFLTNLLVFLSLPLDYRGLIKTEIVTIFFSDISPKPSTMPTTKEALGEHLLKEASSLSNPYPSYTLCEDSMVPPFTQVSYYTPPSPTIPTFKNLPVYQFHLLYISCILRLPSQSLLLLSWHSLPLLWTMPLISTHSNPLLHCCQSDQHANMSMSLLSPKFL